MNHPVPSKQVQEVALGSADQLRERIRQKSKLKGRQPDEKALADVRDCIGLPPAAGHRRDLLIENLHAINDRFGALREPHLVALAREMNIPMAEVYEVATFYHHFEVVRGRWKPPACAAWAAPASRPAANGASCAPSRPAPHGDQHRRRRARHLQGPRLSRARPAPLPGRRMIAAWAVGIETIYIYLRDEYHGLRAMLEAELARCARIRRCQHAADRSAPRRRRLHLRRRVGHDRIDRRQARHAAPASALRGAGRPVRPAHAGTQLRDPALGARHRRAGPGVVRQPRPPWPQGPALVLGLGPRARPGRQAGPGRHHDHGTDRGILRRHAGGHQFYAYLPGGASGGILPASMGDIPLDFDTLQPYGCFIGSAAVVVLSHQDTAKAAALNTLRFFKDESCGQCTPCRAGTAKAVAIMEQPAGTSNCWATCPR
jgi:hypothetical protein